MAANRVIWEPFGSVVAWSVTQPSHQASSVRMGKKQKKVRNSNIMNQKRLQSMYIPERRYMKDVCRHAETHTSSGRSAKFPICHRTVSEEKRVKQETSVSAKKEAHSTQRKSYTHDKTDEMFFGVSATFRKQAVKHGYSEHARTAKQAS